MIRYLKWALAGLTLIVAVWATGSMFIVAGVEEAKYQVIEQRGGFEIRRYAPALVAETDMPANTIADRGAAFRAVAGYIFGANDASGKIAMTAPVVMDAPLRSEKIAMTAPVIMDQGKIDGASGKPGTMKFVLPARYKTLADLPKPLNPSVRLQAWGGKDVAALQFSWYATPERVAQKAAELETLLARDQIKSVSAPYLASYDPPFSIPFLKRHEILIDVATRAP
jgi:SOUL heme-binding protein